MIRVGVQGASGRTGSLVLSVIDEFKDMTLGAALVSSSSKYLDNVAHGNVLFTSKIDDVIDKCDVFIDFSSPESSISLSKKCSLVGKPLLIATTGFTPDQIHEIDQSSIHCPILLAPNTSLGIYALKELTKTAEILLGDRYDIEISEIHHNQKKDAPSGTAILLADGLSTKSERVYDRSKRHSIRGEELGISVIRGGDVVGEHTVYFIGKGERIELTHRAWDRRLFARGALELASKLISMSPGLYRLNKAFLGLT